MKPTSMIKKIFLSFLVHKEQHSSNISYQILERMKHSNNAVIEIEKQ